MWQSKSPFSWFFPFKIVLAILAHFLSHMNFLINLSSSVKTPAGNLTVIELNLWISLERIDIFTILSLPIQEHVCFSIYLDLFKSSSVKFYSLLFIHLACFLFGFSQIFYSFVAFVKGAHLSLLFLVGCCRVLLISFQINFILKQFQIYRKFQRQ